MRFSSIFVVLITALGACSSACQTVPSPGVSARAQTEYTLDDGIGAVAVYPGAGYRSFVPEKFLVSSLAELESQLRQAPRGTTLRWLPHHRDNSGNPILFASGQYEQFLQFCQDHEIKILIERTYRPHVDADGTYARTVIARTDEGRTPIAFRSIVVHPSSNAPHSDGYLLQMLYDPKSKLFHWEKYGVYSGYSPEANARLEDNLLSIRVIYLASDQMSIFGLGVGASIGVAVSTERENSLAQGQASAIRAIEGQTSTHFRNYNLAAYLHQLPPGFFEQCVTDIDMPIIHGVQHQPNHWQVSVAAQNGNVAVVSLDDNYNLISTKVTLNPDSDAIGRCKKLVKPWRL
jgi:hypothetical protein